MAEPAQRMRLVVGGLVVVAAVVLVQLMSGGGVAPVPDVFATGGTLASAEARGAQTGRPVLVLVHADWCGPCQTLKRGALTHPQLAAWISENTVAVAVEADDAPEAVQEMGVRSLPSLVLRREGRTVAVREGVASANRLQRWLDAELGPATAR
jgi:thioredoxin 1